MSSTGRIDEPAGGNPVECLRCFGIFSAVFMHFARCPALHPFCRDCIRQHAKTQLEAQNLDLKCMHTSGCQLPFTETELKAHLSEEQLKLRERIIQRREFRAVIKANNAIRRRATRQLAVWRWNAAYAAQPTRGSIRPVPAQGTSINTPGDQPSALDPAPGLDEGVPVVHAHPRQASTIRPALRDAGILI
ncbi:hypothetical protein NMY22_g10333 [Coprinellus aureogranulatus]|nr:hypothetical protein NMY22_g10333 [Coprinellus aureogranulatus]